MKNILVYTVNLLCCCLLLFLFVSFNSCKKIVRVEKPLNQVASAAVFADWPTANAAMAGLYSEMMRTNNNLLNGGTTLYTALSSDELVYNGTVANQLEFNQNNLSPTNSILNASLWRAGYLTIYHSNAILESLEAAHLTDAEKKQLAGEAKLVRALSYFYMVNLFGDVPLVKSTDYRINASMPRTPATQVEDQVISDLQSAKDLLPAAYPTPGRVRPNKWAAAALLARAYLYNGNWAGAETEATEVINTGIYTLSPNLNNVFLAASTEAIWQLLPVNPSFNTWEGQNLLPSSATVKPGYMLTAALLNAFEAGDARKTAWVKTNTVTNTTYYYPYKYKVKSGSTVTENYIVLRLAELFLIRAEARAQQGNITGAQDDLNTIRKRAGLPGTTANDQSSLLLAIEQERRIELMAEWGHRWFDLKRTGRANAVLSTKSGWQTTDTLYPIPYAEIQLNMSLTQNQGY